MRRAPHFFALAAALSISVGTATAQSTPADDSNAIDNSSSPVANVYVTNIVNPNAATFSFDVYAFTAASNGKLTEISGSPLNDNLYQLGENGKYLFGINANGTNIDSYRINSNGSLTYASTVDASALNPNGCGPYIFGLKVDHSGSTVYDAVADSDCFGDDFQYFKVNESTGALSFVGQSGDIGVDFSDLEFTGNDKFAYSNTCTLYDHEEVGYLIGFSRQSSGKLSGINLGTYGPYPKENGNEYCPLALATDPNGHLAGVLESEDANGDTAGNPVIATFSTSSSGKLSTTSTYKNMPQVKIGFPYAVAMNTSGNLLATGGAGGLQLFHYNGASPATTYKTLLSGTVVDALYWDKSNHLYVVTGDLNNNPGHGKLHVFTATSKSVSEASGSPYTIPNGYNIIVENR